VVLNPVITISFPLNVATFAQKWVILGCGLLCPEARLADYEALPNSLQLFKSLGFERQLLNAHICPRVDFVPRMASCANATLLSPPIAA